MLVSLNMAELILGGTRSGKSALAQARARDTGLAVVYVATAVAGDDEMQRRIERHRRDRPPGWLVIEEQLRLADTLQRHAKGGVCVVVDCVTLWLSNLFFAGEAAAQAQAGEPIDCPLLAGEVQALLERLDALPGRVILVSNEIGCGIIADNSLSRAFADEQGRMNQALAAHCDRVTWVLAGIPLDVKTPT